MKCHKVRILRIKHYVTLPKLFSHLTEKKCGTEVSAVAEDFDSLVGVNTIFLQKTSWIILISKQIVYLELNQASENVFVNLVEAEGTSGFQDTFCNGW